MSNNFPFDENQFFLDFVKKTPHNQINNLLDILGLKIKSKLNVTPPTIFYVRVTFENGDKAFYKGDDRKEILTSIVHDFSDEIEKIEFLNSFRF